MSSPSSNASPADARRGRRRIQCHALAVAVWFAEFRSAHNPKPEQLNRKHRHRSPSRQTASARGGNLKRLRRLTKTPSVFSNACRSKPGPFQDTFSTLNISDSVHPSTARHRPSGPRYRHPTRQSPSLATWPPTHSARPCLGRRPPPGDDVIRRDQTRRRHAQETACGHRRAGQTRRVTALGMTASPRKRQADFQPLSSRFPTRAIAPG